MYTEQRKTLDKYIQCLFSLNLIGTVGETSLPIKLKFHQRLTVLQISFFLAHLSISPEPIGVRRPSSFTMLKHLLLRTENLLT